MTHSLVIGAGPVGTTVAAQLIAAGHDVTVGTRSGTEIEGAHSLRLDVRDGNALDSAMRGVVTVYHCAHTAYSLRAFERDLLPAEESVLGSAARAGAVVAFPESLYSFAGSGVIDADSRPTASAGMGRVRRALLAQRAGSPAPTVSVAAADFYGPGVRSAIPAMLVTERIRAGARPLVYLRGNIPHSLTYVPDLARAMIVAAGDPALHNSLILAPTAPAPTQREFIAAALKTVGRPDTWLPRLPIAALRTAALFSTTARGMLDNAGQWRRPLSVDSGAAERLLGFGPTPIAEGLRHALAGTPA